MRRYLRALAIRNSRCLSAFVNTVDSPRFSIQRLLLSVLYMTLVWSFTPFISPNPSFARQLAIVPGGSQLGGELDVEVMYGSGGAPLYKASVYVPKVPD